MKNFARITVIVSLSAVSGPVFAQSAPAAAGDPDAMTKLARTVLKLDIVGHQAGYESARGYGSHQSRQP